MTRVECQDWHIAILLVSYANPEDVVGCLQSVAASNYRNFSVFISENGPVNDFDQLCETLQYSGLCADLKWTSGQRAQGHLGAEGPRVDILASPGNPGYAGGINRCLELVGSADAIWVLNPDTVVHQSALAALVAHAQTGGYGITGSRLVNPATRRVQLYGGRWRRMMARGYNIGFGAPEQAWPDVTKIEAEMDYVNGASMLVSRPFLEQIGPMHEDYFLYCEEIDWCLRRGDFRLGYAHECVIYHAHGSTLGSSHDRRQRSRLSVYLDERNKLLLTRRLYPALFPLVVVTTFLLAIQYLRHGAFGNYWNALAGWWAGLCNETGKPEWLRATPPIPRE
jgi:N-acetylglucosaminyl-diphospho-decaprenol L-rhamnosyltransferase